MTRLIDGSAVVFDRQPLWLEALEQLLVRIGVTVAASTTSPAQALTLIESQRPSLLVAGLAWIADDHQGLACIKRARLIEPELKLVALSLEEDPRLVEAVLAAGANAHCAKSAEAEDLALAIRQVLTGGIFVSRQQTIASAATAFRVGTRVSHLNLPGAVGTVEGDPKRHAFEDSLVQAVRWDGCTGPAVQVPVAFLKAS
ncbi:MAG: response regulator [Gaiellaceae bacterium]